MELTYTTRDGRMTATFSGTQSEIWEQIAHFQEVFETGPATKGGESDDNVRFVVREVDDNKYYELRYAGSNPKLFGTKKAFGQHKKGGGLFPKNKDADGNWLPDNGWTKWNPETKKEE